MMRLFEKYADWALLAHFLRNPSGAFYVTELAKRLQLSPSSVSTATREFERDGILTGEEKGLAKFYKLNNENPFVRSLKVSHVLARLHGVRVVEKLLRADDSIFSISLHGDFASGAYDERSELRLLVLTNRDKRVLTGLTEGLEKDLGVKLRLEVLKVGRWRELSKAGDPLYKDTVSQHLLLYGAKPT